jgi:tRNA (guanine37-N1)-methyltransferase
MIRFDIITIHPELIEGSLGHSIIQRGRDKGLININLINLRDYATNKHNKVDDYSYGGGAGMVMMIEPVDLCLKDLKSKNEYDEIIYLSPDGKLLDQQLCNKLSLKHNYILLCGHYKGIDERIREHLITMEISIGDYVLTGGELGAAILCDAVGRLIPGVMSDETSALTDSFQDNLIAPPVYTRPAEYKSWKVPELLLSGNEKLIAEWRHDAALERTLKKRPGLLDE